MVEWGEQYISKQQTYPKITLNNKNKTSKSRNNLHSVRNETKKTYGKQRYVDKRHTVLGLAFDAEHQVCVVCLSARVSCACDKQIGCSLRVNRLGGNINTAVMKQLESPAIQRGGAGPVGGRSLLEKRTEEANGGQAFSWKDMWDGVSMKISIDYIGLA